MRHETPKRNLPVLPWDGNGSKLEDPRRRLIGLLPELRGYARFLARDRAEADDLVQDAVVRALAALPRLSDDAALRPWLFTILRNTFYEQARRRRTERTVLSRQVTGSEAATPGQHGSLDLADLQRNLFIAAAAAARGARAGRRAGPVLEEAAAICGYRKNDESARFAGALAPHRADGGSAGGRPEFLIAAVGSGWSSVHADARSSPDRPGGFPVCVCVRVDPRLCPLPPAIRQGATGPRRSRAS